jgi:hypothetical protein
MIAYAARDAVIYAAVIMERVSALYVFLSRKPSTRIMHSENHREHRGEKYNEIYLYFCL